MNVQDRMNLQPSLVARHAPMRACMLAYTFYENDGRVMRYAEALAQDGVEVDAIVLGREEQAREEMIHGVRVIRVQTRQKNEKGKLAYLWRLLCFFVRSMFEVTAQHLRKPYCLIHVHSVPDFEVLAALVPKLLGARIILDIHDIVPEFYAAKFGVSHRSPIFAALRLVERVSAAFADHVIAANDIWLERLVERATRRDKCTAFINYPDTSVFHRKLRTRVDDGRFVVIYPGTLNWHQGLDLAVRAFAAARIDAPTMELHIYGEGPSKPELQRLVIELALQDRVFLHAPVPLREIAGVMANADLGVVPKRNDSFGGEAFSTKILEFMALGVPLVVADTRIDRHYFDATLVRFFLAGDADSLAQVLVSAYRERGANFALASKAYEFAEQHSWAKRKVDYLCVVRRLVSKNA